MESVHAFCSLSFCLSGRVPVCTPLIVTINLGSERLKCQVGELIL